MGLCQSTPPLADSSVVYLRPQKATLRHQAYLHRRQLILHHVHWFHWWQITLRHHLRRYPFQGYAREAANLIEGFLTSWPDCQEHLPAYLGLTAPELLQFRRHPGHVDLGSRVSHIFKYETARREEYDSLRADRVCVEDLVSCFEREHCQDRETLQGMHSLSDMVNDFAQRRKLSPKERKALRRYFNHNTRAQESL